MADNPELRIVITGEDATGKQAPPQQSGQETSKQAAPGPAPGPVSERSALDTSVAANLAALREAIARNDKTSKEAFETLKVLGSEKSAITGAAQYRALLESLVKGRIAAPPPPASQPAPKLPEIVRAPRLPAPGTDAASRQIIVLGRDQYSVDATPRGGAIGPPRPPEWRPPRLPSPGQPPSRLPTASAAGGGMGGGIPPRLPGPGQPQGPYGPFQRPGDIEPPPPSGGVLPSLAPSLAGITLFTGALYFGTRIVGEFIGALRRANAHLEREIERYRPYEANLATAAALRDVQILMGDIRRAQVLGPRLAQYTTQSGNTFQAFEDLKASIERILLPAITALSGVIQELLTGLNLGVNTVAAFGPAAIQKLDTVIALMGPFLDPATLAMLKKMSQTLAIMAKAAANQNMQAAPLGNADEVLNQLMQMQFPQGGPRGPFQPPIAGPLQPRKIRPRGPKNVLGGGGFF